jgi:hypothetical protein
VQSTDDSQTIHLLAEASEAASIAGNFAGCAETAVIAGRLPEPSRADDAVLRDLVVGMGLLLGGDRAGAVPMLRRVVDAGAELTEVVPLAQAGRAAWYLGDEPGAQSPFERAVRLARERGRLGLLPYALNRLAASEVVAGRWESATAYSRRRWSWPAGPGRTRWSGTCSAVSRSWPRTAVTRAA